MLPDNNGKYISSQELANLTNRAHDDVIYDVRTMFFKLQGVDLDIIEYRNENGKPVKHLLGKNASLRLARGYGLDSYNSVTKFWEVLESNSLAKYTESFRKSNEETKPVLYVLDLGDMRKVGLTNSINETIKNIESAWDSKILNIATFNGSNVQILKDSILNQFTKTRDGRGYLSASMKDIIFYIGVMM